MEIENQKGEVNIKNSSPGNPAYVPGYPFTNEDKGKSFLYSVGGYLLAFIIATILIVIGVYL